MTGYDGWMYMQGESVRLIQRQPLVLVEVKEDVSLKLGFALSTV
jgi:hypothetical protein